MKLPTDADFVGYDAVLDFLQQFHFLYGNNLARDFATLGYEYRGASGDYLIEPKTIMIPVHDKGSIIAYFPFPFIYLNNYEQWWNAISADIIFHEGQLARETGTIVGKFYI